MRTVTLRSAATPVRRESGSPRNIRSGVLDGREWAHLRVSDPRGLVFAPPLLGGGAGQQIAELKGMARRGYDIFSFTYSGHGPSGPPFSLRTAVRDTRVFLSAALDTARVKGLPPHGIGACFGALPLVEALASNGEPLERLVLVNALPGLPLARFFPTFWEYHRRRVSEGRWRPERLRESFQDFMDSLFPGVVRTAHRFGRLAGGRVRLVETLMDLAAAGTGEARLEKTPVLSIYARNDQVLGCFWDLTPGGSYETAVRRLCPGAEFLAFDGDHYVAPDACRARLFQAAETFLSGKRPPRTVCGSGGSRKPTLRRENRRCDLAVVR